MDDARDIEPIGPDERTLLPRHLRRGLAHLRDNLSDKVTLSELAAICAVPERTLLKQFQKCLGLPPLAYLRRLRLNVARSRLTEVECKDTVADIAMNCGFTHLGRFAREYRRAFGETPSTTRQRARDRVADTVAAERLAARGAEDAAYLATPGVWREKPSLLILPLRTETSQECREARDLTERLGAMLARMRIATVTLAQRAHVASMKAPQPRNAATQYALFGRLTRDGERTRVIVRLVDVVADRHIWGDSFDGTASDPFALQDRVVDNVLCGVVSRITDAEIERVHSKDPRDRAARDLAMQAFPLILATNVPSTRDAITILNRAIELDPASALPIALLACCQAHLGMHYGTTTPGVARAAAMQLAQRAGVLDDRDPMVTLARGVTASFALRSHDAEMLVSRALAMDPTSTWAWERRGMTLISSDPARAIADFVRAQQLRGPSLSRSNCFAGIAQAHAACGRLDDALLWTRKALVENPAGIWMYILDSCFALKAGDLSRLLEGVTCMRRSQPEFSVSLITATYPPADPVWLEALARAGMPLT